MKFTEAAPTEGYFMRWVSENGIWEFGLRRMIFGVRVSANLVDAPWGEYAMMDYCAGAKPRDISRLCRLGRTILEGQPESITGQELRAMLPGYAVRPVVKDEACMTALTRLAAEAMRRGAA